MSASSHAIALGRAVTALYPDRELPLPANATAPRLHFDFPVTAGEPLCAHARRARPPVRARAARSSTTPPAR
jgi:hypothetical protein